MKAFIFAGFALGCITASAANWVSVATAEGLAATDPKLILDADISSVRLREGFRQAWIRYSNFPSRKSVYGDGSVGSTVYFQLFDCETVESTTMQYAEYDQIFANGNIGYSSNVRRADAIKKMQAPIPGTMAESALKFVCARPLK